MGQSRGPVAPVTAATDPCVAPANKIVAENCKPGRPRTEWDVFQHGDPEIQGFATDMSVNLGETVDFKIRTHSPRYRLDIYRMGWYGGDGARLIETIRPSAPLPQAQPECIVYPQMRLTDCGNWKVSASWRVPADGVSGVYVARLVREDDEPVAWRSEGNRLRPTTQPPPLPHRYGSLGLNKLRDEMKEKRASHVIFVVRDDAGRSDVLFQTSDATWVAVNRFGGSSLYGWSSRRICNRTWCRPRHRPTRRHLCRRSYRPRPPHRWQGTSPSRGRQPTRVGAWSEGSRCRWMAEKRGAEPRAPTAGAMSGPRRTRRAAPRF